MKIYLFIILELLLISCREIDSKNLQPRIYDAEDKKISAEKIKGKWYLNKWTYYHTLDFGKDSIFVDNHIDSVFILNYRLSHDTLITWTEDSKTITKNRIIKISKDTLVFENFLNTKHQVNYSRTERKFEN